MKQSTPEKDDEKDKKLEDYYEFEKSTDKELETSSKRSYFDHVKSLIPLVKRTQKKVDKIRKQLRKKIKELEKKARAKQKKAQEVQKNNPEADMVQKDLAFCKDALSESKIVKAITEKDLSTLKEILATKEERSFSVMVDVALRPLPSDRAKNRQNENDSQQQGQGNRQGGATSGKLTPAQLAALRGTPDKTAAADDDKTPVATSENTPKRVMTAADKEKILAARNGIAPENMGQEPPKRQTIPNNIDYSRVPLPSRGRSSR